jgi:hypothetical protein
MADNEIDIVITASGNAEKVISGIANVLSGVTDSVKSLTKNYIAYGDQVKSLSLFTGMQSDETSRLIQLADDAFVSFETLRMSARLLADKGIAPTTENLAKLSDAYLALQPGVERSQFLLDNFGRAGIEMGKIMELGGIKVREMSAAISDSLIIDDEKAARILASKQAVDEFNDSVEGIKYEAADRLLGIFKEMPTWAKNTTLALGAMNDIGGFQNIASLLISLSSLNSLMKGGLADKIKVVTGALWGLVAAAAPLIVVGAAIAAVTYTVIEYYQAVWRWVTKIVELLKAGAPLFAILKNVKLIDVFSQGIADDYRRLSPKPQALGGPVLSGTPYIVGERGPELFTPSNNGFITPNNKLGGNTTIILNYQPMVSLADRFELETKLTPIIRNAMRGLA